MPSFKQVIRWLSLAALLVSSASGAYGGRPYGAVIRLDTTRVSGSAYYAPHDVVVDQTSTSAGVAAWLVDDTLSVPGLYQVKILARRLDSDGKFVGPPMVLHGYQSQSAMPAGATQLRIAVNEAGQFVVAWTESDGLHVRPFGADGLPVAPATTVPNSSTRNSPASVAIAPDGRFAVAWRSRVVAKLNSNRESVFLQQFDATGKARGQTIHAMTQLSDGSKVLGGQTVAYDPSGLLSLTWGRYSVSSANKATIDTYVNSYDTFGRKLGGKLLVIPSPASTGSFPMDHGLFIDDQNTRRVVSSTLDKSLVLQRFDDAGNQIAGPATLRGYNQSLDYSFLGRSDGGVGMLLGQVVGVDDTSAYVYSIQFYKPSGDADSLELPLRTPDSNKVITSHCSAPPKVGSIALIACDHSVDREPLDPLNGVYLQFVESR